MTKFSHRCARHAFCTATLTLALSIPALSAAQADNRHETGAAPEGHAPIMVMGDHRHKTGEFMVSLRHMSMKMSGNIKGTDELSAAQVLAERNAHGNPPNLRVVPQEMEMNMTMLGAMYAPSDKLTLLAMVMQIDNEMTLQTYQMDGTACPERFTSKASGQGDTIIGALIAGGDTRNGAWHYGLALSLPTGGIKETGRPITPMMCVQAGMDKRLPYPMQLGSGSYDFKPSLTYNGDWGDGGKWRVGAQANAVIRLNDNDGNYRLGDKFELQGWVMRNLSPWASASLRFDAAHQNGLKGGDSAINLPVPTAQTRSHGGTYANISLGVNLIAQTGIWGGALAGHRLAIEWVSPVHQDANGVQMQRDDTLMIGWQKAF